MASVEKRGKNSYRAIISTGFDPKLRKYGTEKVLLKARTKKEAQREADEIEGQILRGEYIEPNKMTLADYLQEWLKIRIDLKEPTWHNYKLNIDTQIIPTLGHHSLQKLNPFLIQDYVLQKLKNGRRDGKGGLSARTVNYQITILSEALDHAVYPLKLIRENPAKKVTVPTVEKKEIKALDLTSLNHLLNTTKDTVGFEIYALIYTAIFTGMRRGELLGLSWENVDFEHEEISVKTTLQKKPGGKAGEVEFFTPKTLKSKRKIVLLEQNVEVLKALKKEQAKNKLQLGPDYNNEFNLVFCNANGTPITPDALRHKFDRVTQRASLKLRFHDLRHSHATLLLAAGIGEKVASERLGHSSTTITHDIYEHVDTALQAHEMRKLKQMMQPDTVSAI